MQVNGRHTHAFFNPAGIVFELRCSALPRESASRAHRPANFLVPRLRWRIALCSSCRTHLGWLFTGARSFAGLISGRIRISPAND